MSSQSLELWLEGELPAQPSLPDLRPLIINLLSRLVIQNQITGQHERSAGYWKELLEGICSTVEATQLSHTTLQFIRYVTVLDKVQEMKKGNLDQRIFTAILGILEKFCRSPELNVKTFQDQLTSLLVYTKLGLDKGVDETIANAYCKKLLCFVSAAMERYKAAPNISLTKDIFEINTSPPSPVLGKGVKRKNRYRPRTKKVKKTSSLPSVVLPAQDTTPHPPLPEAAETQSEDTGRIIVCEVVGKDEDGGEMEVKPEVDNLVGLQSETAPATPCSGKKTKGGGVGGRATSSTKHLIIPVTDPCSGKKTEGGGVGGGDTSGTKHLTIQVTPCSEKTEVGGVEGGATSGTKHLTIQVTPCSEKTEVGRVEGGATSDTKHQTIQVTPKTEVGGVKGGATSGTKHLITPVTLKTEVGGVGGGATSGAKPLIAPATPCETEVGGGREGTNENEQEKTLASDNGGRLGIFDKAQKVDMKLEWSGSESCTESPTVKKPRRRIKTSPSTASPNATLAKRRLWSAEESHCLIQGVSEIGQGKWKEIRMKYFDILGCRTPGQLKDRYRNIVGRKH